MFIGQIDVRAPVAISELSEINTMFKTVTHLFTMCLSTRHSLAAIAAVMLIAGQPAYTFANDLPIKAGDLHIEQVFTFATPPGAMAAGGYLTITNTGSQDDCLLYTSPSPRDS